MDRRTTLRDPLGRKIVLGILCGLITAAVGTTLLWRIVVLFVDQISPAAASVSAVIFFGIGLLAVAVDRLVVEDASIALLWCGLTQWRVRRADVATVRLVQGRLIFADANGRELRRERAPGVTAEIEAALRAHDWA